LIEFKVRVERIALLPDGKSIVGTGKDLGAYSVVWDLRTGKELRRLGLRSELSSSASFALTPDGKRLLVAFGSVEVWHLQTGKLERRIVLPEDELANRFLCPVIDNKTFIVANTRKDSGVVAALYDLQTGKRIGLLKGKHKLRHMVASPDGRWLLTASDEDVLCLWDLRKAQLVHTLYEHTTTVTAIAFSPDSKWCASATKDVRVWVFDRAKGSLEARARTLVHSGARALAFSPDGKTLVGIGRGAWRGLAIWDWRDREEIRGSDPIRPASTPSYEDWTRDISGIGGLAISPDGRTLYTTSEPLTPPGKGQSP
jgi:WD40 repeat protein